MYLGIDVGGSKILLAVFDAKKDLVFKQKIITPPDYSVFLSDIKKLLGDGELSDYKISACCCALPGRIDRKSGKGIRFSNLLWGVSPIVQDFTKIFGNIPIFVENDAKLAGLGEAQLVLNKYKKVLYLTVSTGLGGAIIQDGKIDPDFLDFEPGQMLLEHDGKLQKWEDISSGKALKKKYGQLASEIDDPKIWQQYVKVLAVGIQEVLAATQPDVVIIGGGVGAHFEKFGSYLIEELNSFKNPLVPIPPIIKAKHPEEAVIYGCYEYIQQQIS